MIFLFSFISIMLALLWIYSYKKAFGIQRIKFKYENCYKENLSYDIFIQQIKFKDAQNKMESSSGIKRQLVKAIEFDDVKAKLVKNINEAKKFNSTNSAPTGFTSAHAIVGLYFMDKFNISTDSNFWLKNLATNIATIYNGDYPKYIANYKLASMISCVLASLAPCFATIAFLLIMGKELAISALIGILIVVVVAVLKYDEYYAIEEKCKEKQEDIEKNFSDIVLQLTLLVCSGININRAWQQVAMSSNTIIGQEMLYVSKSLDNGTPPVEAYNNFINRCNNVYTSKLANALLQNIGMGNDKLHILLTELAQDSLKQKQEYAKRQGIVAEGQLVFPILMMFLAIIILIIGPVVINIGGA